MDDGSRLFLWLLLTTAAFGLLGGLFGALTGYVTGRDGRAAGGRLGYSVVRAFDRLRDEPFSDWFRATLVGGVDGTAFSLGCGLTLGLITGWRAGGEWQSIGPILLGGTLLAGGAVILGLMAYVTSGGGMRAVAGVFAGGVSGALLGLSLRGVDGLFAGMLLGAAGGALLARAVRR